MMRAFFVKDDMAAYRDNTTIWYYAPHQKAISPDAFSFAAHCKCPGFRLA
jgi:hypothetical protein